MDLNEEIFKITTALYDKKHIVRGDIQVFISLLSDFISKTYNPFLHDQLKKYLFNAVSEEAMGEINRTFKRYKDPFEKYGTE